MIAKRDLPECPVATTINMIGSKWKVLILRDLLQGPRRFGELERSLQGISKKVLTESLRSMEDDGILVRKVYPDIPPKVEYSLSELGTSLRPLIAVMEEWGTKYRRLKVGAHETGANGSTPVALADLRQAEE